MDDFRIEGFGGDVCPSLSAQNHFQKEIPPLEQTQPELDARFSLVPSFQHFGSAELRTLTALSYPLLGK